MPVMPRPKKAAKIAKKLHKGQGQDPQKNYARTEKGEPKLESEIRRMIKR